jgi:hypothetical protein
MAQTKTIKVSALLADMIEQLAKKKRKSVEQYLSELVTKDM